MTKGKFGLSTSAIAVIAFIFCALRQTEAVLLVAGFALLAEKDEWLNRQVLQALLLSLAYSLVVTAVGWVFGGISSVFSTVNAYGASAVFITINSFITGIVYIAFLVFAVLAILKVARGNDAAIPWISNFAGGDLSSITKSNAAQPYQQPYTPQPQQYSPPAQSQYSPPAQTQTQYTPQGQYTPAAVSAPTAEPEAKADVPSATAAVSEDKAEDTPSESSKSRFCVSCGATLNENSRFCTSCGTDNS